MNSKKVNIVVLNYNNYRDTIECIDSILKLNYVNYNLIVVDNASTNNSFEYLNKHFKFLRENSIIYNYQLLEENENCIFDDSCQFYLTRTNKNNGYSSGNNIGIKISMEYTNCDYIWILNNDTVVDNDSLMNQVSYFNSQIIHGNNLGILGSKILNYSNKEKIQSVAGSYNKVWGITKFVGFNKNINEISQIKVEKIDFISGASMFVSRASGCPIKSIIANYSDMGDEMAIWGTKRTIPVILGNSQSFVKAKNALKIGNLGLLVDTGKESLNPNIFFLSQKLNKKVYFISTVLAKDFSVEIKFKSLPFPDNLDILEIEQNIKFLKDEVKLIYDNYSIV